MSSDPALVPLLTPPTVKEPPAETVRLLEADPDLGAGLKPEQRAMARQACVARVVAIPPGGVGDLETGAGSGYGLLVLSGLLCRRVGQDTRRGAELVGPGDVIRPSDPVGQWSSIPIDTSWLTISPARVAVLDRPFAYRAARFPEVAIAINARGLRRVAHLATMMGVVGHRRVETRLVMLFWHLADRFGRTGPDGVEIALPLTHGLIGEMIAVRRPSVTGALVKLGAEGVLSREGDVWTLSLDSAG